MPYGFTRGEKAKILVLNPNSSQAMTDGMKTAIDSVDLAYSTEIHTYTAPSDAPASINNALDISQSASAVMADLKESSHFQRFLFDGVLVACFSVHPLVPILQTGQQGPSCPAVTGIFEASILAALSLLKPKEQWGIVTTGKFWEEHLYDGVGQYLGALPGPGDPPLWPDRKPRWCNEKFAGVQSTGLNASDFHDGVDPAVVRKKLKEATKRLLRKRDGVACIVMGCAGMAGLEEIIREAASELRGEKFAYEELHVIDGVRAGIMQIETMIKHQRQRPGKPSK